MGQGDRFRRKALKRGYKVDEVDEFLERAEATLARQITDEPVSAADVRDVVFRTRFGGYDEWQVDLHLDRLEKELEELASGLPPRGSNGFRALEAGPSAYREHDDRADQDAPAFGGGYASEPSYGVGSPAGVYRNEPSGGYARPGARPDETGVYGSGYRDHDEVDDRTGYRDEPGVYGRPAAAYREEPSFGGYQREPDGYPTGSPAGVGVGGPGYDRGREPAEYRTGAQPWADTDPYDARGRDTGAYPAAASYNDRYRDEPDYRTDTPYRDAPRRDAAPYGEPDRYGEAPPPYVEGPSHAEAAPYADAATQYAEIPPYSDDPRYGAGGYNEGPSYSEGTGYPTGSPYGRPRPGAHPQPAGYAEGPSYGEGNQFESDPYRAEPPPPYRNGRGGYPEPYSEPDATGAQPLLAGPVVSAPPTGVVPPPRGGGREPAGRQAAFADSFRDTLPPPRPLDGGDYRQPLDYPTGEYGSPSGGDYAGRRGKDMTVEMQAVSGFASPFTNEDKAVVAELRSSFRPRRFGSGYDPGQVERLFDAVQAMMEGRSGVQVSESDLMPGQFGLVQGGYFEDDVDEALRQVRGLFSRRMG